jgi:hypothetical protein
MNHCHLDCLLLKVKYLLSEYILGTYDLGGHWQDYRTLGEEVFWQKMNKTGGPTANKCGAKYRIGTKPEKYRKLLCQDNPKIHRKLAKFHRSRDR